MATKAPKQAQAPMAAIVAAATGTSHPNQAATVLAPQQPAAVPATQVQVPATYSGLPFAQLTKTQQSFATAKHAPSMPKVPGALTVVGAKAYKVRSGNNAAWWQAMQAAGCASAQGATPAQLQAAVAAGTLCPKFLGYAIVRGWVVPAAA
jgi:hypothetical protein